MQQFGPFSMGLLDTANEPQGQSSVVLGVSGLKSITRFHVLNFRLLLTILCFLMAAVAWGQTTLQPPIWASKPDASAFEKIVNDHLAAADGALANLTAVPGA